MSIDTVLRQSNIHELGIAHMFLTRNISNFHHAALKQFDLSTIEWLVLSIVCNATKEGGIRVTDLAIVFDVKTTYMTSVLNKLRSKRFITTHFDENDARVRLAVATPAGAKQAPLVEEHVRSEIAKALANLISAEELATYIAVVQKLGKSPNTAQDTQR